MLEVTVRRTVTHPEYQVFTSDVRLNGFAKLTPAAARAAVNVAFGAGGGEVTCSEGYGYKVYANSVRKFQVTNY
jgi:hypothetical protein